jgi:hypothetical protein
MDLLFRVLVARIVSDVRSLRHFATAMFCASKLGFCSVESDTHPHQVYE